MQILSQARGEEIVFDRVCFAYGDRKILEDVSFKVKTGETFVIVGECGFGKSTMLKLCCALLRPQKGSIMLRGRDTGRLLKEELMKIRQNIGYVFQNSALISNMNVFSNIALPLIYHTDYSPEQIRTIVNSRIELLNLKGYEKSMPAALSMGVMKRAGVARALALMPSVMFYDEPTSALDPLNAGILNDIIKSLHRGFGVTSVVVTHDVKAALDLGTTVAIIANHRIIFCGTPEELKKSGDSYIQQFFSATGAMMP